ncbi:MAG: cysteine desulfurase [Phycisphaerae bacterium]|nr:MAG: cysteine desulfurase [Planctomycetota bacterium]KAB2949579.1 MAG: cysteine desulfurase [Phycisphaerae bacterium]MBE7455859.1 cysteine desulfurase [Planctomycetia bacterium]MCK6465288.1 cysteine desulfurase [Phycisphaerae bacterium]MCL4717117.1 cysteine desulfurase [Phycisphaerae bacterium]
MIYLDYNASTPLDPRAREAMLPYLNEWFGNPSAPHALGRTMRAGIDRARRQVAALLNATPEEIVFTSGGTESNNTVLRGLAQKHGDRRRHLVTSAVEHPAVLKPCAALRAQGFEVTEVPVDSTGRVDPEDVRRALRDDTLLVSIMHANNEVGTIQPVAEIAGITRERGVFLHTDAAQSAGKIPTDVQALGVDFLSIAGHKLYAPQGIGALYLRKGCEPDPLLLGAGHESGRRAGTEAVPLIVALGVACEVARPLLGDPATPALRDELHEGLRRAFKGDLIFHGCREHRLPNTLNVGFRGCLSGELIERLPGVCVTAAAACHAGSSAISPVLAAMKVDPDGARGAIRFSLGRLTTSQEIRAAVYLVAEAANACHSPVTRTP